MNTEILNRLIQLIDEHVADFDTKRDMYTDLISLAEEFDCDDIYILLGDNEVFDFAYRQLYDEDTEDEGY